MLAFVFGATVGSFLNVVIWRLPRGQSLSHPGSHCPHCERPLAAWENIPLVSFLALRARCRTCQQPIASRYFWVELLTAAVFLALYLHFGPTVYTVAYCLFAAALIAAFFIDLELFIIPDELNAFALLIGIGLDLWGVARGEHALLWGCLPRSILGAMICASIFVFIQILGLALFKKDAMGDGDVKLARAIGAMLPIGQALVSFLLAIGVGAVLGGAMLLLHSSRAEDVPAEEEGAEKEEPIATEQTPFGTLLLGGALYLLFLDLVIQAGAILGVPAARKIIKVWNDEEADEEDDFVPGPTHIPFGPYMVMGALLAVFVGDRLIQWYLNWAHLTPP